MDLALDQQERRPRELAIAFTNSKAQFISEASVYCLLEACSLIISPAYIALKAADEFRHKATVPSQLWQTDSSTFRSSAGSGSTCPRR